MSSVVSAYWEGEYVEWPKRFLAAKRRNHGLCEVCGSSEHFMALRVNQLMGEEEGYATGGDLPIGFSIFK